MHGDMLDRQRGRGPCQLADARLAATRPRGGFIGPRAKPLLERGHDAVRQDEDDHDHEDAVEDPLHFGCGEGAHDHRNEAEDHAADDRPGQRALAAGDHHDHHRHGVDEQENVGIDDPDIMRVEAAGGTGDRGRDHSGQHQIARDVDADRDGERLVLLQRDHGAADARMRPGA